jgi:hypothetical protein
MSDFARVAEAASILGHLFWDGEVSQEQIDAAAQKYCGWPPGESYPMPPDPALAEQPPSVVNVPAVTGDPVIGGVLSCTMGVWNGEPTGYAYQWQNDGAPLAGATATTYTVAESDAGHALACVVTATNPHGSTAAPASNAIDIPAIAREAESHHRERARR